MEKLKRVNSKHFKARIYMEDIKEITHILSANDILYVIETESYAYEDFLEFKEHETNKLTNGIDISSRRFREDLNITELSTEEKEKLKKKLENEIYFSVRCDSYECFVFVSGKDLESTGLFEEISNVLNKRVPRFRSLAYQAVKGIVFFGLLVLVLWPLSKFPYKETNISILAKFLFLTLSIFFFIKDRTGKSEFILREKVSKPNFFIRKKDDLILAIISGLIGALLGAFLTSVSR